MKNVILTLIALSLIAPAMSLGSEGSEDVIVYTSYPDDVISYIYVIPAERKETGSEADTKIAYLKPPVFTNQIFVSRNYKTVLCTKYTICD
jgi:hypothetical protein